VVKKIISMYVFVVSQNGLEQIVMWPDKIGNLIPLVYLDKEEIVGDNMREGIQKMANAQKLYFELREYQLVEESVEQFYPASTEYNA